MSKDRVKELIELGQRVVEKASGAEVVEVLIRDSVDLSAKVRLGEPELIEEAGSHAIGLRVIAEGRMASTFTSDPSPAGLDALVHDAMELAALSEPDEFSAPPEPELLVKEVPDLDLFDQSTGGIDAKTATERALIAEQAARDLDPKITNSEGATYARTSSTMALVTKSGFAQGYAGSYASLVVNPVADDVDGKKRTGFYWDARRHLEQMSAPEAIGKEAAQRTLDKLGAKKVSTCSVPVVFDPDAGRALLSALFSCISGTAIYKRSSYLCEREGEKIASDLVTIVDDPLIPRAPGSRPFDGEGLESRPNVVVDGGVLKTYLLNTYAARKLGRQSTGSAARGFAGRPSVSATNFHLKPKDTSPESIIGDVQEGLYVTSMMGFGFNAVTGDFSRGAEGFWIEKGKKTFPVSEITISLNFNDLWGTIDAIGNDLDPKTGFATPTFRVQKMTVAGS